MLISNIFVNAAKFKIIYISFKSSKLSWDHHKLHLYPTNFTQSWSYYRICHLWDLCLSNITKSVCITTKKIKEQIFTK